MSADSSLNRAGRWFLNSGIQTPEGGVARYYLADAQRNKPVSTEITGYSVSAFVYLYSLTKDSAYLDRARAAARFLIHGAWRADLESMPFEVEPTEEGLLSYFFDSGIIARGLLAVWRATGEDEFLNGARAVGCAMARDFPAGEREFHPILVLPEKRPLARDAGSWSRSPGCYQLKPAMAWFDLSEATGEDHYRRHYDRMLEYALATYKSFLPGHENRLRVMDRLHAFSYFLEGCLPCAGDAKVAAAMRDGIGRVAWHLREIGPEFARSDVYAQLLRVRLYADWLGVLPLDSEAAGFEARRLAGFQISSADPRIDGGFYFGRKGEEWVPHVNPVSAAFGLQALALWDRCRAGAAQPHRHLLV